MELNKKSTSAKLYRWYYGTQEMPNSICGYAWKWLLMWVTTIPLLPLTLPSIIMDLIDKDFWFRVNIIGRAFAGFVIYIFAFGAISMIFSISLFWVRYPHKSNMGGIQFMGGMLWACAIGIGLYYLCGSLSNKIKNKSREPNIMVEYFKSKKNKYCASITWK